MSRDTRSVIIIVARAWISLFSDLFVPWGLVILMHGYGKSVLFATWRTLHKEEADKICHRDIKAKIGLRYSFVYLHINLSPE